MGFSWAVCSVALVSLAGPSIALAEVSQDAKVTLTIGAVRGEPGDTVHVPVTVATGENPVSLIILRVDFEPTVLQFNSVSPGLIVQEAGKWIDFRLLEGKSVKLVVYGGKTTLDDGALLTLAFDILPEADLVVTPLRASGASASDPDACYINVQVNDGQVAVGPVAIVTVTPSTAELAVAQTQSFKASSTDPLDTAFAWETSDPSKASVSRTGVVTGLAPGEVTIMATGNNSGVRGEAVVTVAWPWELSHGCYGGILDSDSAGDVLILACVGAGLVIVPWRRPRRGPAAARSTNSRRDRARPAFSKNGTDPSEASP